jgi:uncharacterized protein YndB with AHSA1/START domain
MTPRVFTEEQLFSRTTTVIAEIPASTATVWAVLIDAAAYPEWTSTVIALTGWIGPRERLQLISALDPSRVFRLRVREYVSERRLVWGDRIGRREFTLTPHPDGTSFHMRERLSSPLLPLFIKQIPPFDASFERFARDLQHACCTHPDS